MFEHVVICFEDDDVATAARTMSESKVRRLPVLARETRKLVGTISLGDLTRDDAALAGRALEGVSQPSPMHNQSAGH